MTTAMKCHYCKAQIDEAEPGWGYYFDDVTTRKTFYHIECLEMYESVALV